MSRKSRYLSARAFNQPEVKLHHCIFIDHVTRLIIRDWRFEHGFDKGGYSRVRPSGDGWARAHSLETWITAAKANEFFPEVFNFMGRLNINNLTNKPLFNEAKSAMTSMLRWIGTLIHEARAGEDWAQIAIDRFNKPRYPEQALNWLWWQMHIDWPEIDWSAEPFAVPSNRLARRLQNHTATADNHGSPK